MLTLSANAQSILGIKVGESYGKALEYLKRRYTIAPPVENGGNILLVELNLGGIYFNLGTLYFQWDTDAEATFSGAQFLKWTSVNDTQSMKRDRDYIKNILSSKYTVLSRINDQGFKCYIFASDEESGGIVMNGSLDLKRTKGNDGRERLYLSLEYAPEAVFIHHNSDF